MCRHVFARPAGKRCLVVSCNGITISRLRNGSILHRFPSALPNGSKRDISGPASSYSILDCIFHEVLPPDPSFLTCLFFLSFLACSFITLSSLLCCSLMKHITSLIWSVGEATPCTTAPLSLGSFGWILSSWRPLLVILHQRTIATDSVLSLYTSARFRVFKQHTQEAHHMWKMACCFTTSNFSFYLWWCLLC